MKLMERVKKAKKNKKGFTLVELIVVIVILGILAAILVPSFSKYMKDANEAKDKVTARSLYIAANYVYAKNEYDLKKVDEDENVDIIKGVILAQADLKASDIGQWTYKETPNGHELAIKYESSEGAPAVLMPEDTKLFDNPSGGGGN